jgi:hypothetical protein
MRKPSQLQIAAIDLIKKGWTLFRYDERKNGHLSSRSEIVIVRDHTIASMLRSGLIEEVESPTGIIMYGLTAVGMEVQL